MSRVTQHMAKSNISKVSKKGDDFMFKWDSLDSLFDSMRRRRGIRRNK